MALIEYPAALQVPPMLWNTATKGTSIWSSLGWLTSTEPAAASDRRYIVADDGRAAAAVYPMTASSYPNFDPNRLTTDWEFLGEVDDFRSGNEREQLAQALGRLPPEGLGDSTVTLSPWAFESGLWLKEVARFLEIDAAITDIAAAWSTPTRGHLYVGEDQVELRDLARSRGYIEMPIALSCELALPFSSFEDYLASLSPSRRGAVRREERAFQNAGLSLEPVAVEEHVDVAGSLAAALQDRHGHGYDPGGAASVIRGIVGNLGDQARMIVAKDALGKVVSFVLYLVDDSAFYPKLTGFTPGYEKSALYFNTVYYSMIREALNAKAIRIDFGIDAYEAKVARGSRPIIRYALLRPSLQVRPDLEVIAELQSRAWTRRRNDLLRVASPSVKALAF